MWHPEFFSEGDVTLLRLPLSAFGDGSQEASAHSYRALPKPRGDAYDFHNRFVGDDVLYGTGNGWGTPDAGSNILTVVPVKGGEPTELDIGYGIDRIEPMGSAAVVIGSDTHSTYFSAIELGGREARLGDRYVQPDSAQAETRSHGFFFSRDEFSAYDSDGVLGLPVARPARPAYHQLFENSISMVFVRREHAHFSSLGTLDASDSGIADDSCIASCVDWYGNARPIFLRGRTLALMGYEIVEGNLSRDSIKETARVSFAPRGRARARGRVNAGRGDSGGGYLPFHVTCARVPFPESPGFAATSILRVLSSLPAVNKSMLAWVVDSFSLRPALAALFL